MENYKFIKEIEGERIFYNSKTKELAQEIDYMYLTNIKDRRVLKKAKDLINKIETEN